MHKYDLIIIGGGPSGINVAQYAAQKGLSYLILEKGQLVNSIVHFPDNMTFFSTSRKLEIAGVPFISHTDKPSRREALEYYRRLVQSNQLNVHLYEPVLEMRPIAGNQAYTIRTTKDQYQASHIVVATGFYDTPRLLNVPGEKLPKVKHYYDDAHAYIGQKVLVIGAANSACDVALECWQKGAEVTMAIRSHEIYSRVKYWIKPNIENRIAEGSIPAYFNTIVTAIYPDRVDLKGPEGDFSLDNDWVLAMTGYQPNAALLEALNLEVDPEDACLPLHNAETLETNSPGVYLAGVVCAGKQTSKLFIENTRDHAEIIVEGILAKQGAIA
ncbi:MAG: YpdA family putative bacillithiol disulfide reductase [Bacteroidota bacterium]